MKLIIGLGNPGEKYKDNRHNVGHMVIDRLRGKNSKLMLFKSNTFMNSSGDFAKSLLDKYYADSSDLIIVHDDLDLPLGTWKEQFAKGPKEHGGINDIEQKLETKDFTRIRVGVDNRKPEDRTPGDEYVLQDFSKDEKKILESIIKQVCARLSETS